MATQITNYQCPACTGPLHFVGESGRLECDYCGSSFDIAEIEAFYAEKEAKAAEPILLLFYAFSIEHFHHSKQSVLYYVLRFTCILFKH